MSVLVYSDRYWSDYLRPVQGLCGQGIKRTLEPCLNALKGWIACTYKPHFLEAENYLVQVISYQCHLFIPLMIKSTDQSIMVTNLKVLSRELPCCNHGSSNWGGSASGPETLSSPVLFLIVCKVNLCPLSDFMLCKWSKTGSKVKNKSA